MIFERYWRIWRICFSQELKATAKAANVSRWNILKLTLIQEWVQSSIRNKIGLWWHILKRKIQLRRWSPLPKGYYEQVVKAYSMHEAVALGIIDRSQWSDNPDDELSSVIKLPPIAPSPGPKPFKIPPSLRHIFVYKEPP